MLYIFFSAGVVVNNNKNLYIRAFWRGWKDLLLLCYIIFFLDTLRSRILRKLWEVPKTFFYSCFNFQFLHYQFLILKNEILWRPFYLFLNVRRILCNFGYRRSTFSSTCYITNINFTESMGKKLCFGCVLKKMVNKTCMQSFVSKLAVLLVLWILEFLNEDFNVYIQILFLQFLKTYS